VRFQRLKDDRLAHGNAFVIGLDAKEIEEAREEYHSKACAWSHSAAKVNKTPLKKINKQVAFKNNNLFVLAAWFVAQHNLQGITVSLDIALTIAYALSTGRYRLDDTLLTGRSGSALDCARTTAFFTLSVTMSIAEGKVAELYPLIQTILFGSARLPASSGSVRCARCAQHRRTCGAL
jgi:hypothetical protein